VEKRGQKDRVANNPVDEKRHSLDHVILLLRYTAIAIGRNAARNRPVAAIASNVSSMSFSVVRWEQIDIRSAIRPRMRVVISRASPLCWTSSAIWEFSRSTHSAASATSASGWGT